MSTVSSPPAVLLSWSATGLGANFQAYRIYRRPSRTPAPPWELIGEIDVPAGYSAANVETQHEEFIDYEAGWISPDTGQWADGWDYAISVVDDSKNAESPVSAIYGVQVTGDVHPWLTCNAAPYLNLPIEMMPEATAKDDDPMRVYLAAGRDQVITRTAIELPARRYDLSWDTHHRVGEDQVRGWRAAASSGLTACLLLPLGDRVIGAPSVIDAASHTEDLTLSSKMRLIETDRSSAPAWYNLPCGLILNGSTHYIEHGDDVTLDPVSSEFSAFCYAQFAPDSGEENAIAKADGSGQGWRLYRSDAANMNYQVISSSGSVIVSSDDNAWVDGTPHLAVGVHGPDHQELYLDDTLAASSTSGLAIVNNALPVRVGSISDMAADLLAGNFHAWGVYKRALTATDVANLYHYLAGHPGYRPPPNPSLFVDLRDDRCWSGAGATLHDLSGNGLYGTVVSSPATRGQPWPLRILDRF